MNESEDSPVPSLTPVTRFMNWPLITSNRVVSTRMTEAESDSVVSK